MNKLLLPKLVALGGLLPAIFPLSFAQDQEEEEVFELSPFVVDASGDQGYRAANTLAGSRLNTSLADVASSVSVFTREFIDDLGAVSEEDLMAYSSAAVPELTDQTGGVVGHRILNTSFGFRVRGVLASRTRNYFSTVTIPDTYNTERFDESRGPNSILFGLGGGGGILNATTKRATLGRNFGSVEFKTALGDFDLYRTQFDYNKTIGDNLAIRLNALYEDDGGWRPHEFKDNHRFHIASTWRISEKAIMRVEHESGTVDGSRTRNFAPFDEVSQWLASGRPTVENAVQKKNDALGIGQHNTRNARVAYVANDGSFRNFQGTVRSVPSPATDNSILRDHSIVPFNANLAGPSGFREIELENTSAYLEAQPFENFFIELSTNTQRQEQLINDASQHVNNIYGEPAETFRDGAPNPYAGMLYIENTWTQRRFDDEQDTLRAVASYSFELGERLGRHSFAGLWSRKETDEIFIVSDLVMEGAPFNRNAENARNRVYFRTYIPNENDASQWAQAPLTRLPDTVTIIVNEGDAPRTFNTEWVFRNPNFDTQELDSYQFSGQSYFFKDRLVATYGWRSDAVVNFSAGRGPRDSGGRYTLEEAQTPGDDITADSFSWGVVGKPTNWLSLLYNDSENFNLPGGGSILPDDRLFPIVRGQGKDVGMMLNLFRDKVYARLTYFDTTMVDEGKALGAGGEVGDRNDRILDAVAAAGGLTDAEADARRVSGSSWDVLDRVTDGYEFMIGANPSENWRITANFTKSQSVESNIAKASKATMEVLLPQWQGYDQNLVTENAITIAEELVDFNDWLNTITAVEGVDSLGSRDFQARIFTRYTFNDGRAKGLYIGGGYKYSSSPIIGASLAGELFEGETLRELDLLIGYQTKVNWFGNGKQTLALQLNAQDLLQENDFISIRINPDGQLYRARPAFPTRYTLSAKLRF